MGNSHQKYQGGLIYNQSKQQIVYSLNKTSLQPKNNNSQTVKTTNFSISTNSMPSYQKKQVTHNQDHLQRQHNQQSYLVPSGRALNIGLKNNQQNPINSIKTISISTKEGKSLLKNGKVTEIKDCRYIIQQDLNLLSINQTNTNKLNMLLFNNNQVQTGKCKICNLKNDLFQYKIQLRCPQCQKDVKRLWVCRYNALSHIYCEKHY